MVFDCSRRHTLRMQDFGIGSYFHLQIFLKKSGF